MQLSAVAQNLEQVQALVDTMVDYIRLGYPYCRGLAEYFWPPKKIEAALEAIVASGKIPQFQWLISPASSSQGYIDNCLGIIKKFPRTEVVVGHWGGVELSLDNIILAAHGLAIYNSSLVCLLRERGIRIIGLPLGLDTGTLSDIINTSPEDTIFEYHLWGPVMSSHWWRCAAGAGNCNPQACIKPVKSSYRKVEFSLCGQALWLASGVDNLSRVQELSEIGVERGLIQLTDIPLPSMGDVINSIISSL